MRIEKCCDDSAVHLIDVGFGINNNKLCVLRKDIPELITLLQNEMKEERPIDREGIFKKLHNRFPAGDRSFNIPEALADLIIKNNLKI